MRVGWQLDENAASPIAALSGDVKPAKAKPANTLTARLSCTAKGGWTKHPVSFPATFALEGDTRVALVPDTIAEGDAVSALVVRGKPQLVTLLPALKKKDTRSFVGAHVVDGGVIASRLSFVGDDSWKPGQSIPAATVDMEVAWWSARYGGLHRSTIKKQPKPETVRFTYYLRTIVEGGAIVQPGDRSQLLFVPEAGLARSISPPDTLKSPLRALMQGDHIVLADRFGYDTRIASSMDSGATWTTSTWSLGSHGEIALLDGAPVFIDGGESTYNDGPFAPRFLQPIDPMGKDPPAGLKALSLPEVNDPIYACGDTKGWLRFDSKDLARVLEVTFADGAMSTVLTGSSRVIRFNASKSCVDAATAFDDPFYPKVQIIVSPRDLTTAWALKKDGNDVAISKAVCGPPT